MIEGLLNYKRGCIIGRIIIRVNEYCKKEEEVNLKILDRYLVEIFTRYV